jgi:hypothetical protein
MRARRRRYPGLRLRDIRDSSHHVLMQSDDIRQRYRPGKFRDHFLLG